MNAEYVLKRFLLFLAVIVVAVSINFIIPRLRDTNPIKERLYQLAAQGGVNVGKMEDMIEQRRIRLQRGLEEDRDPIYNESLEFQYTRKHFWVCSKDMEGYHLI